MNRVERVREKADEILLNMTDAAERRCAYVHTYGVAQACALLAARRGENAELAVAAAMLHDIYACATGDRPNHAHKGAEMARDILSGMALFSEAETDMICTAIRHHSDKAAVHSAFDELLKDADVLQHALYDPLAELRPREEARYNALKKELSL